MKLKFDRALSLVAVGVIGALQTAYAAPVYEIQNIENYELNGTIESTINGYGMGVNQNDQAVGISKGKKKLEVDEDTGGVIDIEDGIPPEQLVTYSILSPILANNFTFTSDGNGATGSWLPTFSSVFGTTDPKDTDENVPSTVNSINAYFYSINDAGLAVGSYSAPELKVAYTGDSDDYDFWYYREFEQRGFVKKADGTDVALVPPYTVYTEGSNNVTVGGVSVATAINATNLVAGYATTDIASSSADRIDNCIEDEADTSVPVDVCVQADQYPNSNGYRRILYQTRAMVWQLDAATDQVVATELALPDNLDTTGTRVYTAQGLGVNSDGTVVGRSHINRKDNKDKFAYDAAYWEKDTAGDYQYHWIEMTNDELSSIAYDINDNGILVGSYRRYIEGYLRDKFFYYDTKAAEPTVVTPNDFYDELSDRSSRPRDINNNGQVVGYVEVSSEKEKPRIKAGFLFDKSADEFNDINDLLVCESKGYVQDANGDWNRNEVQVTDGNGDVLSYETDIRIVEANAINDAGTIVGTAFIRKPSYQYDDDGELVLGSNGSPLFSLNANGQPVTAYVPRMVVLKPTTSGAACSVTTDDNNTVDADYVRKGAASFAWLFLLPLVWLRRRQG
ncbi:DUF3466 family protein [Shewanella sp. Isolate11]|uniref:DUF3466 family protein n=1 Tax=Shewanella sp. Isolate11 TaxID=2908530 RepID=UPI001EFEDC4B|nr:DUF3466 family protein [Shewanella sp. Isolate11]MCG9696508.1 DUF3466 family protein [Shewanella sp. Isolate11]